MSIYQVLWLAAWIAVPFLLDWTWTSQSLSAAPHHGAADEDALRTFLLQRPPERDRRSGCVRSMTRPHAIKSSRYHIYPTSELPHWARCRARRRAEA